MSALLPPAFAALEPWVSDWALPTQNARWDKRLASTSEEISAFYDALLPYLEQILNLADEYPLGAMPADVTRLFDLALMLAEISPNVELYRADPNVPYSFSERRFIAVHGDKAH